MKIKFISFWIPILFFSSVHSQQVDSHELIINIKSEITTFFIKEGYLKSNDVQNSLDFVFAIEIQDKRMLGSNINGIYRIGVHQSHSDQHILIKEDSLFRIFNINKIDEILKGVIDFSMRNNVQPDALIVYIKEILRMYEASRTSFSNMTDLN